MFCKLRNKKGDQFNIFSGYEVLVVLSTSGKYFLWGLLSEGKYRKTHIASSNFFAL
jgi:hypothetical protein